MMRQDVLYLVDENPAAHGIFGAHEEERRLVYCAVKSVSGAEFYRAMEQDLHPTFVFVLRDYAEYNGEKVCYYNDKRYRIVRTYITAQQTIELTVEEATVDA